MANFDGEYSGDVVVPEKVKAKDEKEYPVTAFGENCFKECKQLKSVAIPSTVTSLGNSCFYCCSSLTSITIPSSVTSLGNSCFYGCSKLESVCFECKCLNNIIFSSIPTTCILYVPKEYLQAYKDANGSFYPYIYEWKKSDGGDDKPTTKCETPTITYADGSLQFSSSTAGAECHYTITDADVASNKLSQDGKVTLTGELEISVYATADGYEPSDAATATLYWINANLETDPSTNINLAKTRGIVATSDGGIVTLSGLDNGEVVSFFSPDGRQLGAAKAENGIASCAVMESGVVIAKVGKNAIKIAVKK